MLVVTGSRPRYGDADAMTAAGANITTSLTINGTKRKLAISDPQDPNKPWNGTTSSPASIKCAKTPRRLSTMLRREGAVMPDRSRQPARRWS